VIKKEVGRAAAGLGGGSWSVGCRAAAWSPGCGAWSGAAGPISCFVARPFPWAGWRVLLPAHFSFLFCDRPPLFHGVLPFSFFLFSFFFDRSYSQGRKTLALLAHVGLFPLARGSGFTKRTDWPSLPFSPHGQAQGYFFYLRLLIFFTPGQLYTGPHKACLIFSLFSLFFD
jgi:hypothetical protein